MAILKIRTIIIPHGINEEIKAQRHSETYWKVTELGTKSDAKMLLFFWTRWFIGLKCLLKSMLQDQASPHANNYRVSK